MLAYNQDFILFPLIYMQCYKRSSFVYKKITTNNNNINNF